MIENLGYIIAAEISCQHCRGSTFVSKLHTYYDDRFLAFGFLAVPYRPADPNDDYDKLMEFAKQTYGYSNFGYWKFFNEDDAAQVMDKHVGLFYFISRWFLTELPVQGFLQHHVPGGFANLCDKLLSYGRAKEMVA